MMPTRCEGDSMLCAAQLVMSIERDSVNKVLNEGLYRLL
jgi:hypothetical protein